MSLHSGPRVFVVMGPVLTEKTGLLYVCAEDLRGEELWAAKDLSIPVYNTEDGKQHGVVRFL